LLEARHALMRMEHEPARKPPAMPPGIENRRLLRVAPPPPPTRFKRGDYKKALAHYDRRLIAAALELCGGRLNATQRVLGISRTTLKERMKEYDLTAGMGGQSTRG
jgi:DNA-binding NtrC family response regulator